MRTRRARPARFLRTQQLFAAIVPALVVLLSITGFVWAQKSVAVVVDGQTRRVTTQATDVAGALRDARISVGPRDVVTPPIDSAFSDGETIVVRRAVPVKLEASGESIELEVVGRTVSDALVAAGLDPEGVVGVRPGLSTLLTSGMAIVVPRAVVRVTDEEVDIAYGTITQADPALPTGSREIVVSGAKGSALRIYRTLVTDGVEGTRSLITERVLRKPRNRVIAVGTGSSGAVRVSNRPARVRAVAAGSARGTHIAVTATAYAPGSDGVDWRTATGARAGLGVVAVDPRVIPLGTRVFVPGYGYGVASDTGGAIKGSRIDLCFDDRGSALRWGRRNVSIVILD